MFTTLILIRYNSAISCDLWNCDPNVFENDNNKIENWCPQKQDKKSSIYAFER